MAPAGMSADLAILRSISFQISSTPAQDLPRTIGCSVHGLKQCTALLSQARTSGPNGGDVGVTVHRFLTQISTLLQGRKTSERWTATVLIKAVVDAGGYEILSKSKHWVTGLISNLRRPEPPSLRILYITTLTKIFALTRSYPSLVREITTPALPGFIKTSLANAAAQNANIKEQTRILQCLSKLLPHHTTIFRTFVNEIRRVISDFTGIHIQTSRGSMPESDPILLKAAYRLNVLLHACEPKQGASTAWATEYSTTSAHLSTLLQAYFSEVEERSGRPTGEHSAFVQPPNIPQLLSLAEHVRNAFDSLTTFILTGFDSATIIPIKSTFDLVQKTLSHVVGQDSALQPKFNKSVSEDFRNAFISSLPNVHLASLRLLGGLLSRYGTGAPGLCNASFGVLEWIFENEAHIEEMRVVSYSLAATILELAGSSVGKEAMDGLSQVLKTACADVLSIPHGNDYRAHNSTIGQTEALLRKLKEEPAESQRSSPLQDSAMTVIVSALTHIPTSFMPDSIRNELDRVAVLTQHKDALLASTLHTGRNQSGGVSSSLLPFLARQHRQDPAVEALIRPRMPVLVSGQISTTVYQTPTHDDAAREGQAESADDQLMNELHHDIDSGAQHLVSMDTSTDMNKRPADEHVAAGHEREKRVKFADDLSTEVVTTSSTEVSPPTRDSTSMNAGPSHDQQVTIEKETIIPRPMMEPKEVPEESTEDTTTLLPKIRPTSGTATVIPKPAGLDLASVAVIEEEDETEFVVPELTLDVSSSDEEEE